MRSGNWLVVSGTMAERKSRVERAIFRFSIDSFSMNSTRVGGMQPAASAAATIRANTIPHLIR